MHAWPICKISSDMLSGFPHWQEKSWTVATWSSTIAWHCHTLQSSAQFFWSDWTFCCNKLNALLCFPFKKYLLVSYIVDIVQWQLRVIFLSPALFLCEYILVSVPLYMSFMLGLVESPGPKQTIWCFAGIAWSIGDLPALFTRPSLFLATHGVVFVYYALLCGALKSKNQSSESEKKFISERIICHINKDNNIAMHCQSEPTSPEVLALFLNSIKTGSKTPTFASLVFIQEGG